MESPFLNKPQSEWVEITQNLVKRHPLDKNETVKIILDSWGCIFDSKICGLQIGKDIFPNPQMMGFFIESVFAAKLSSKHPNVWQHGRGKNEKDLVCLTDDDFSVEIKSSSSRGKIFANRSYAQEQTDSATKGKNGFYLSINFEKFLPEEIFRKPEITLIRFGYVEHSDWKGQNLKKGSRRIFLPRFTSRSL